MLKLYRKRFIVSNMLLSGIVLLVTFILMGTVTYRSEYNDLENTMIEIIKPWNTSSGEAEPSRKDSPPPAKPDKQKSESPDNAKEKPKPDGGDREGGDHQGKDKKQPGHSEHPDFISLIYHTDSETLSVLSNNTSVDEEQLYTIVQTISDTKDKFGVDNSSRMIFYKETTQSDLKVVLINRSYITIRVIRYVLFLVGIFIVVMTAIFFISLKLSKVAVSPLETAIERERSFVQDISHDLKTPITVILTNNNIISSSPESKVREQLQWVNSTEESAKDMMKLVNEMLTLSSLESVGKSVDRCSVSLSSAAEKSALQMESVAYERGVEIRTQIEDDISVMSDPEYTGRICTSLIENALKYEPQGGIIEVSVCRIKKHGVLTVRNFGSVIAENDLPHIFERFYRGDKSRNTKSGHGLGLPIVKRMTELVNAAISVSSTEDSGTTFTVLFEYSEKL